MGEGDGQGKEQGGRGHQRRGGKKGRAHQQGGQGACRRYGGGARAGGRARGGAGAGGSGGGRAPASGRGDGEHDQTGRHTRGLAAGGARVRAPSRRSFAPAGDGTAGRADTAHRSTREGPATADPDTATPKWARPPALAPSPKSAYMPPVLPAGRQRPVLFAPSARDASPLHTCSFPWPSPSPMLPMLPFC